MFAAFENSHGKVLIFDVTKQLILLRNQNNSFRFQSVQILSWCLENVMVGQFFECSEIEHIIIIMHEVLIEFWSFLHWIHIPGSDSKSFWNCNCDFLFIDWWRLRDLNHAISYSLVSRISIFLMKKLQCDNPNISSPKIVVLCFFKAITYGEHPSEHFWNIV